MSLEESRQAVLKSEIPVLGRPPAALVILRDQHHPISGTDPEHLGQNPLGVPRMAQAIKGEDDAI
jgi:hypothetical protein